MESQYFGTEASYMSTYGASNPELNFSDDEEDDNLGKQFVKKSKKKILSLMNYVPNKKTFQSYMKEEWKAKQEAEHQEIERKYEQSADSQINSNIDTDHKIDSIDPRKSENIGLNFHNRQPWSCYQCNFSNNSFFAKHCSVCGSSKPQSTDVNAVRDDKVEKYVIVFIHANSRDCDCNCFYCCILIVLLSDREFRENHVSGLMLK